MVLGLDLAGLTFSQEQHTPPISGHMPTPISHPTPALYNYHGHSDQVEAVAWNPVWGTGMPDGTRIASGGYDKTAQVWAAS